MDKLCYKTLEDQGFEGYLLKDAPEKVLQFGEGNFLRAFVDYFIDMMNEKAGFNGKVVLTQPIAPGLAHVINGQEGLYTLFLRGRENGEQVNHKRVISSVSRCLNPYEDYQSLLDCAKNPDLRFLVSNTTEAGIVFDPDCKAGDAPPSSFPGKMTAFLYERWKLGLKGFIILSCELIDHNGDELKRCVGQYIDLWGLEEDFRAWVGEENIFCSTLVDRIVTGYPRGEAERICRELGYQDDLIDTGEVFGFWVIEGPQSIKEEFPVEKAGLPIIVVDDHTPYKQRKVRILNGAHTSFVLASFLCGNDTVLESMNDSDIRGFLQKTIYDEVIPTLDLPEDELVDFAKAVESRFENPYVKHALLSISLNSVSKWRARCMPSLLAFAEKQGEPPARLTFSLAALMAFYSGRELRGGKLIGYREGKADGSVSGCAEGKDRRGEYMISDDAAVLTFFAEHSADDTKTFVRACLAREDFWGQDLTKAEGLVDAVTVYLSDIRANGMRAALCRIS